MTTITIYSIEDTAVSLTTARDLADTLSDHLGADVRASLYNGTVSIDIADDDWDGITEQRAQDFIEGWLYGQES